MIVKDLTWMRSCGLQYDYSEGRSIVIFEPTFLTSDIEDSSPCATYFDCSLRIGFVI